MICTKCYYNEVATRSPLHLCRACYHLLGKHGRHDLTWLRSLSKEWRKMVVNVRLQALVEDTPMWPLYRGPVSGYGEPHWGIPKRPL